MSNLTTSPNEVSGGESLTISVDVTNTGEVEGSYTVVLKVNGSEVDTQDVTVAGGATETVTFSVSREEAGDYTVEVDDQSGSFTVVEESVAINWSLVGGIIGGVLFIGLVFYLLFVLRRPREAAS